MKEKIDLGKENKEGGDFSERERVFSEYFPEGKIEETRMEEIPEEAIKYFESKSKQFILPEDYKPGNFEKFFTVNHADGKKTFLAQQTKNYQGDAGTEKLTFFVDMENEKVLGRAELRLNINYSEKDAEYFKDKPFIGWIETEKDFQKGGLGERRMYLMNAVSQTFYGLPLYSDTLNSSAMVKRWEAIVEKGEAKKFKEGSHDRYVFSARQG